ncbi:MULTISPECIES: hypothetical protein [Pseudoalteromonas]|uniref:hypothetical protein n=1 Tax=Pseudoalteromonas TaxID=53246 RepID=UPI000315CECC|nr:MULTISPECIES: hypothetical protein [Pseudoalteromonas]MCF6143577.1 hypothetical protein [Pseudoalteromonas mariniglutinosa NCIMB 1770]
MNKPLFASAVALTVLAGCSSTPPVNEKASAEIQAKIEQIKLNGTLLRQQGRFVIAPTLSVKKGSSKDKLATASWQFSGKTLFPAFHSGRFECSLSKDECKKYEEIDSPFLKVSTTDSDYGDTYEERVADGKKPGMSAAEVGNLALASAGAMLIAPALVVVGTPLALIGGTTNLISHGSVWSHNWVEFDHDNFYEQTVVAIQSRYGSLENYLDYMVSASAEYSALTLHNKSLYADLNRLKEDKSAMLNQYQSIELKRLEAYKFEMPAYGNIKTASADIHSQMEVYYANSQIDLQSEFGEKFVKAKALYVKKQEEAYASAKSSTAMMRFIKKYEKLDEAQLINQAKNKWSTFVKKEQKVAFDNIKTISDANNFIATYQNIDEAKLVGSARDLVAKAEQRIQKEKLEKRKAILVGLESWRKGLSVGDQTFCGRVIDEKYPMFQIAISQPLRGFSDTIWLEKDKVFESWSGCNNRNNQLTPISNPLG